MRRWGTRVSLGVTLAALCLALQWAYMAIVGPDEGVIRNGLNALNPDWRDVGAMTQSISDTLRRHDIGAAIVSSLFVFASTAVWLPEMRRDRAAVLNWRTTAWMIAAALPAVLVISFIAIETSYALT